MNFTIGNCPLDIWKLLYEYMKLIKYFDQTKFSTSLYLKLFIKIRIMQKDIVSLKNFFWTWWRTIFEKNMFVLSIRHVRITITSLLELPWYFHRKQWSISASPQWKSISPQLTVFFKLHWKNNTYPVTLIIIHQTIIRNNSAT